MDIDLQKNTIERHVTTNRVTGAGSTNVGTKARAYLTIWSIASLVGKQLAFNKTTPAVAEAFTFVAGAPGNENEIQVGGSLSATVSNIRNAVNGHSVLGTYLVSGYTEWDRTDDRSMYFEVILAGTDGNTWDISDTAGSEFESTDAFDGGTEPIAIGNASSDPDCFIAALDCGIDANSIDSYILNSEQSFIGSGDVGTTIIGSYESNILQQPGNTNNGIYSAYVADINLFGSGGSYNFIIGGTDQHIEGNGIDNCSIVGGNGARIIGGSDQQCIISCDQAEMVNSGGWNMILGSYHVSMMHCGYNNIIVMNDDSIIEGGSTNYNGIYSGQSHFISNGSSECAIVGSGDHSFNGCEGMVTVGGWSNYINGCSYGASVGSFSLTANDCENTVFIAAKDGYVTSTDTSIISGRGPNSHNAGVNFQFIMANADGQSRRQSVQTSAEGQTTNNVATTLVNGTLQIERWYTVNYVSEAQATNAVYSFEVDMVALQTATGGAGTIGDVCNKKYQGLVKNLAGTVTIVGDVTETAIAYDTDAEPWTLTFVPSGETLLVKFTGETNKTIQIFTKINLVELAKN